MSRSHRFFAPTEALAGALAWVVLVGGSCLLSPTAAEAQYQPVVITPVPTAPAPPPPAPRSHTHVGLIVSGAVVLGVGWLVNIVIGVPAGTDPFSSSAAPAAWDTFRLCSLVPVAGPWIQLAVKPTDFRDDYWGAWLIANGIWQGAGAVLLVAGLATIGDDEAPMTAELGGARITVLPELGSDRLGLVLAGAF